MKRSLVVVGMALGAGLMYVLDPQQGRRRRALARDKMTKAVHETGRAMGATSRDVAHRATGLAASLHTRFFDEEAPDEVVEARVHARLGRVSSHPGAIDVAVADGVVTLRGPVFRSEMHDVVRSVSSVRGVRRVDSEMEPHDANDNVPGLQGAPPRAGEDAERQWSPTTRLLVGVAGATLTTVGLVRRDRIGMLLTGVGIAVVTRAASDAGLEQLAAMVSGVPSGETKAIPIPVKVGPSPESRGPRPTGNISDRIH
jgi:hypothetical protein